MPYQIKKIGNYYQVKNKNTGQIKAKRTTFVAGPSFLGRTTKIKAIILLKFFPVLLSIFLVVIFDLIYIFLVPDKSIGLMEDNVNAEDV